MKLLWWIFTIGFITSGSLAFLEKLLPVQWNRPVIIVLWSLFLLCAIGHIVLCKHKEIYEKFKQICGWIEKNDKCVLAIATVAVAIFTFQLWRATNQLAKYEKYAITPCMDMKIIEFLGSPRATTSPSRVSISCPLKSVIPMSLSP